MDQKTWLWRKKSSEKITVSSDKVNLSVNKNEEEVIFLHSCLLRFYQLSSNHVGKLHLVIWDLWRILLYDLLFEIFQFAYRMKVNCSSRVSDNEASDINMLLHLGLKFITTIFLSLIDVMTVPSTIRFHINNSGIYPSFSLSLALSFKINFRIIIIIFNNWIYIMSFWTTGLYLICEAPFGKWLICIGISPFIIFISLWVQQQVRWEIHLLVEDIMS